MKLVVHIGHGKTGSSSIQKTLLQHTPQLVEQRVKYLGLMLEHADSPTKKPWQNIGSSNLYFDGMPSKKANEELLDVLWTEIDSLDRAGFSVAIWSNEWLATRGIQALPALEVLRARGVDIEAQCYVRRHDKWAQSAYLQWGLKHKSYEGPLRDFQNWLPVFGQRDFRFGPSLQSWNGVFGTSLKVFNYDLAGDVVSHFLSKNGISDLVVAKDNVTPDPIFLAAQAVFNSRSKSHVYPTAFKFIDRLTSKLDENKNILPTLDDLTPDEKTLADIVDSRKDDIALINSFLSRSGEPSLSFDKPIEQALHPTPWEMDQFILKLVYSLVEETAQLRNEIIALKTQLNAQKDDEAH